MTSSLAWVTLAALLVASWWYLRLAILSGAGYKAKVLSTLLFTERREVNIQSADEIAADGYRILRVFKARVDREAHTVTASFFGVTPQTAVWRAGLGSTLSFGRTLNRPPAQAHRAASAVWERVATPPTLAAAVDRYFTEPNASRRRRTRSVVVIQSGTIVAERYAAGYDAESLFPGWSVAKSLVPALVGLLVGEGKLSLDDRELWSTWRGPDPRAAISLDDLLRMRSGLRFSEIYSRPHSDVLRMLYQVPDMAAFAASRPLIATPGTRWSYSSGTSNIISAIIRRQVGEEEYLAWPRRALFDRIGMTSALLEADASGTFVLSSYMLATARDWARYGQFHLQDGVWNGARILPEGWMAFCRTPTPQSPDGNYGAHWSLKLNAEIGGASPAAARLPPDAFFSIGHEGQTLTVIPSRDLVIVRNGLSIYIDAWHQAQFVADILDAL